MGSCHLTNSELEPQFKKYKGRFVLRGDIVKDDSGAYAVFTEQGSSASQMTATKVMDVIARLPDCDGQAAAAVSACTQVKLEDAPRMNKIPVSECPDVRTRLPRHKWPKSRANIEDPVVLLERNLCVHPLAGLLWERQSEKALNGTLLGKRSNLGMFGLFTASKSYSCRSSYSYRSMWMTSKWPERSRIQLICGKKKKNVDIEEPTSFLDHVSFGCTQRACKPNEKIIGKYNEMFESRISAGGTEKLPGQTSRKNFSVVLRYGRTCSKMLETVLRIGNQEDRATIQGFQSLFGRSPNWKGSIGKQRWVVKSLLPYGIKMLVPGTNWSTWHSVVSQQMDSSMSQTTDTINFLHSCHEWLVVANIVMCAMRLNIVD